MDSLNENEKKIAEVLGKILTFVMFAAIVVGAITGLVVCVQQNTWFTEIGRLAFVLLITVFYVASAAVSLFLIKHLSCFKRINLLNLALSIFCLVILLSLVLIFYAVGVS